MAERANGGTSIGEGTSAATTRPAAPAMPTCSVRAIGRTAASSRRRASSSEIVDVKGRTRTYFDACWTRCPSSGITSFSIARRTAAGEPGSATTMRRATRPAQARLIIAAGPISW